MTQEKKNVHTPFARRFRFWRNNFLPVLVWCAAICVLFELHQLKPSSIHATGMIEHYEAFLAPLTDGTVKVFHAKLFQEVKQGEVLAVMDDALITAEIHTAQAELLKLEAEMGAARIEFQQEFKMAQIDLQRDDASDLRRLSLDEQGAKLDYLDRVTEEKTNKVGYESLKKLHETNQKLLENKLVTENDYYETKARVDQLGVELEESPKAIATAKILWDEAKARVADKKKALESYPELDMTRWLSPLAADIKVQEGVIAELKEERKQLMLKAPIDGKVTEFFHRIGETVEAGVPLLTISATTSDHIIAYVAEHNSDMVTTGSRVKVISRHPARTEFDAEILRVSTIIEALPNRLRRNPVIPEWGLPILINLTLPGGSAQFRPGETLDIRFLPQ